MWQTPLLHRDTLAGGETRANNRLKPRGQKQQEAVRQYDFKVASPEPGHGYERKPCLKPPQCAPDRKCWRWSEYPSIPGHGGVREKTRKGNRQWL